MRRSIAILGLLTIALVALTDPPPSYAYPCSGTGSQSDAERQCGCSMNCGVTCHHFMGGTWLCYCDLEKPIPLCQIN